MNPNQYVHILNEDTGNVKTEIGPARVVLKGNERLLGEKKSCIVVTESQYCVVLNPYDESTGRYAMGDRKVVVGPTVFALQYNEILESDRVCDQYVLNENQALLLQSQFDHEGKPAGFMWQVRGPCKYIPSKYETIVKKIDAIIITENTGIYIKDIETSKLKLVMGPQAYMLNVNEELYLKPYTTQEKQALFLPQTGISKATVIHLEKGEALCLLDNESSKERVILGPITYVLGPQEGVKVLSLSAGKPKRPNMIKAAKVLLGPSFMSDIFQIRTKDNADLRLHLTYKWQFMVDESDAFKIFALNDFIGYSCQSLCSGIREEAARHNFEDFHNQTVQIIRGALFKDYTITNSKGVQSVVHGLYFEEMNFLVSEIDVKEVTPVNEEINNLLNQSIKSNMVIVCKKMEQEANLKAEKEKVQAQALLQKLKETLIDIENENYKLDIVEKTKIDGLAMVEKARAEKEAHEIKEESVLQVEIGKMTAISSLLAGQEGAQYLELLRSQSLAEVKQDWYITTDAKVQLPLQN